MSQGMSFDEVVPRADDEEEMDNEDAGYELSDSDTTSSEDSSEKCAVCGVPTSMAESKLHGDWPDKFKDYFGSQLIHIGTKEAEAGDCHLCNLVMEAVASWKVWDLQEIVSDVIVYISLRRGGHRVSLELIDPSERRISLSDLEIFRMKNIESPWNVRELTETSGDTSSLQAALVIKQWLHECQRDHKVCRDMSQSKSSPDRVLELTDNEIILRRGADLKSPLQYACLSHCWGPRGPSFRLTSATSEALMSGVSIDTLPQTFQDAIRLCMGVEIHYLWIDALCIFQDDLKDWETAAASMANIYEGASITIAATCSSDSDQGCFSRTNNDMMAKPIRDTGLFVRREKPTFPMDYLDDIDGDLWPLLSRAWVYQERRLSPRVVHLTQEQLYWECGTLFIAEDGNWSRSADDSLKASPSDPKEAWRNMVEHYSRLNLTFDSDRLPAISALVKRMQPLRQGDAYVAGLWTNSLLRDIMWRVVGGLAQARPSGEHPTWSWLSTNQEVIFAQGEPLPLVQVIDISFKIIGPSHIGYAKNASITVKGPFITARFPTEDWTRDSYGIPKSLDFGDTSEFFQAAKKSSVMWVDFDCRTADPPILPGEEMTVLLILNNENGVYSGIILRSTQNKVYERVGFYNFYFMNRARNEYERFLNSLPIKEFKIV